MSEPQRHVVPAHATPKTAAGGGGGGADEIFLSPRVVDRQAFNDFAAQLRELIEQAGAQAEALRSAAADAQRTRDSLRDAVNANQMKLDMATRALASIDQKAEQTRKMIESASDVASRVTDLRAQADQVINERVGILCQRLNEAEDAATERVDALHARLAESLKDADARGEQLRRAAEAASGPLVAELVDLVDRAESAVHGDKGLATLVERAEAAGAAADRATSVLTDARAQAEHARKVLGETLNAGVPIIDEAGTIQGHLESTVSEAVRLTQSARESMAQFVDSRRAAIEEDLKRLAPIVEDARADLEALLTSTHAARSAAAAAVADAQSAAQGLEGLLQQVEPWRRVILGESESAPVGAAINGMVTELKKEIRGVAGALRAIADRTEASLEPQQAPITVPRARRSAGKSSSAA